MSDPILEDLRLAAIYDPLDPDRSDLDVYAAIVEEPGVRTVLDIGCGRGGSLACSPGGASRSSRSTRRQPAWTSRARSLARSGCAGCTGTRAATPRHTKIAGVGPVETWCDLLSVEGDCVTFRWTHVFENVEVVSDSTLRFRVAPEIEQPLHRAGFRVDEVRDAPDRPGRELVFLASRTG